MTAPTKRASDSTDAASRAAGQFSRMLSGRFAVHLVLLLSAVVLPKVLGDEAFGRYAAVLGMVSILETVSSGGLNVAELRSVPPLWRTDRTAALRLASSIWTTRLAFSVVVGVVAAVWLSLSPTLGSSLSSVAAITAWLVFRAVFEATRHEFLAMGSITPMVAFELARAASTLAIVGLVFWQTDLETVFIALALAHAVLCLAATALLRRKAEFSPRLFAMKELWPMLRFGAATSVGMGAAMAQAHLPVYALANWVSFQDAALLAVSVQLFVFAQALLISPWTAVTPVLAELDSNGEFERMREWTSTIIRWSVAGAVLTALGWSYLGSTVLTILPDSFARVHSSGTVMLLAVVPLVIATSLNRLLYVGGYALAASLNQVAFLVATVVGLVIALNRFAADAASAVAVVYVVASWVFMLSSYTAVVRLRGMWLPARRSLLLASAGLLCLPGLYWDAGILRRAGALAVLVVALAGVAVAGGLLPIHEVRELKARVVGSPTTQLD